MSRRIVTEDERALMNHWSMWGSDGYPIQKLGSRWTWGPWRSVQGPPTLFRTKREAVASFEAFIDVLREELGEESYERAMKEQADRGKLSGTEA